MSCPEGFRNCACTGPTSEEKPVDIWEEIKRDAVPTDDQLTLEGDIRYLTAHIETKNRQLADAQLRIDIYKESWQDAERDNTKLREKNDKQHSRISELEFDLVRLQQDAMQRRNDNMGLGCENQQLREELADLKRAYDNVGEGLADEFIKSRALTEKVAKLQHELGFANDRIRALTSDRTSLVEEANELYGKLGRIAAIIDEIVD